MWTKRPVLRASAAITVTIVGWGLLRILVPAFDYFPPESLTRQLERSWIIAAGVRKAAGAVYLIAALGLMAVFFNAVQRRWPGRRGVKGLAFGTFLGVVWTFGFLSGWAFLGTTLRAEFLNIVVDLVPLAVAGWLIGLAVGRDVPGSEQRASKSWLAVLLVALGFVTVHALGSRLFTGLTSSTSGLLLVPTTLMHFVVLAGLGICIGGMYLVLREALPFERMWARVAFFAFGVFGHTWAWFHLFFVIEFAGILHEVLLVGLTGTIGVFVGALAYEWLARGMPEEHGRTLRGT